MENPRNNEIFSSELWQRALESFGSATHLTIKLFDADARVILGPVHTTPLFQLLDETAKYDPGIFTECAQRCLAQKNARPAVLVSEFFGLAVVGTSLMLEGEIVGAAVGGYAFVDFSQLSEVQHLARNSGIRFERLWQVAREQKPVPERRLVLNAELLQVVGDVILRENRRTRQYGAALSRTETALRALAAQLLTSQEDERRRLARELHDDLIQGIVRLQNQVARIRLSMPENAAQVGGQMEEVEIGLANLSKETRNISHGLHPAILDDLGLEVALRQLVSDYAERTSETARFQAENIPGAIPPAIATTLYRITQEALGNVSKHAPGASVVVTLSSFHSELKLVIEDNGPGFDISQTTHGGLGLVSMQERAHLSGGWVVINAVPGRGTRIEVDIPSRGN